MKNTFENQVTSISNALTPAEKIIAVTNNNHIFTQYEAKSLLSKLSAITIKVESELHWHGDAYLKSLVEENNELINSIVSDTRKEVNN